jgi:hypothetical protein
LTGHLFLLLHRFAAAVNGAIAAAGNDKFGTALGAAIPFTYLIRHLTAFLKVMGSARTIIL